MGCWLSLYFEPWAGSTILGALMSTPAIGPATEGLRGFSLFVASQATSAPRISEAGTSAARLNELRSIGQFPSPARRPRELSGMLAGTLSARHDYRYREELLGSSGKWFPE